MVLCTRYIRRGPRPGREIHARTQYLAIVGNTDDTRTEGICAVRVHTRCFFSSQTCRTQESWGCILTRRGIYLMYAWFPQSHIWRLFVLRYTRTTLCQYRRPLALSVTNDTDHTRRETQRTAVCTNNAMPVHYRRSMVKDFGPMSPTTHIIHVARHNVLLYVPMTRCRCTKRGRW